jgi:ornithine cyclodeaminase/alanine dehydrogenase-like protein (mu-crystallin family)
MSTVLGLREHELHDALTGFDALRTVIDELLWREVGDSGHDGGRDGGRDSGPGGGRDGGTGSRRVGSWTLDPGAGAGLAVLRNERGAGGLLLPAAGLRAVRGSVLTAIAARLFLSPDVVTVSVLGSGPAVRLHLAALAAHVPGVSHIAVHAPDGPLEVSANLAEDLELAGIGLTVAASAEDAVFGANLLVLTEGCPADVDWDGGQLASGAVVVNAAVAPPPAGLSARADQVFVDDRGLLPRGAPVLPDLGQVLASEHPGRAARDGAVLVDLLGVDAGGVWLAHRLYETALRRGLGVRVEAGQGRRDSGFSGYEGGTAS